MRRVSNSAPKETTVSDTNKIEFRITKLFVQCKFSEDTKLAGKYIDEIEEQPIHLQLEYLRLRAVHTIVEAAQKTEISRWTLMNYESGK